MSVLNQSGEEQVECPLCMEPLEVDDLNFFPCSCGYQICRFCWHRIRTDENGLCPACRKAYSENPADFIPLSKEQVAQLKAEKRQRDQQRKAKLSESRKHLASVRVVQRNLVFVVGLPMRLADPEVLKKHEYFGKFGKIHKVVINQSTAYAGTQGPSASAYVTYMKSDDALRAIQSVNNSTLDGKTIKTSLGTTKYCSHFMKNQPCPKPDCMYLHDFGDQEASFTKEQMHAGKHQEYEKKLHDSLLAKMAAAQQAAVAAAAAVSPPVITQTPHSTTDSSSSSSAPTKPNGKLKDSAANSIKEKETHTNGKENGTTSSTTSWPHLDKDKGDTNKISKNSEAGNKDVPKEKATKRSKKNIAVSENNTKNKARNEDSSSSCKEKQKESDTQKERSKENKKDEEGVTNNNTITKTKDEEGLLAEKNQERNTLLNGSDMLTLQDENSSFFTSNSFSCAKLENELNGDDDDSSSLLTRQIDGQDMLLEINDSDAWDFDFGYTNHSHHLQELATQHAQRCRQQELAKEPLDSFANGFVGLDTFSRLDAFMDTPYIANTESLLETLAKNSVNYQMHPQQQMQQQQQQQSHRQQHLMNGHKDALLSGILEQQQHALHQQQQIQNAFPKILDMYRSIHPQQQQQVAQQTLMNGLHSQSNGFHNNFAHQQQQQQQHFNHLGMMDKRMALAQQQQRQMEENFLNLTLGKQMPQPQPQQPHGYSQMNGHFDGFNNSMGNSFGLGGSTSTGVGNPKQRPTVVEDKDLDFRFQEAQKALEALVESDSQVHNSGRTTLGSNQLNGLVHSQSGSHLPPPPPGFVQSNTHMNSFGSKILPFLNMNSQQQQQILTSQNNWPSNFSQIQQQQQQQQHNKGMGNVCNDWKVLDTAIISSRRHIPNMGLIDQYAPGAPPTPQQQQQQQQQQHQQAAVAAAAAQQQRTYDMYATFSNYSTQLPPAYGNGYQNHLSSQPNLNWLGNELSGPISTPPGFRTAGQATKQQEC